MTNNLNEARALDAWKDGMGDALTAVKLLRDRTGLGLREAAELIEKTAAQIGGRYNLRLYTKLPAEFAEALERARREIRDPNNPYRAAHIARRGVKKVRGAK
jgi:hypothetical protein